MAGSALLGDSPATPRDTLIRKALKTYRTNFNGNPKFPLGPPRPTPPKPDRAWESNAWRTETAAATFMTLAIVVTLGRFVFAWRRRKQWGFSWDDGLVICAASIAVAYVGHILSAFVEGTCLGKHMWFCTYEDIERLYLTFVIGQTIFYFSVYCAKLSLLFFIRRLTRASRSPAFNAIHWSLFGLLLCCGIISFFGTAFQCRPVTARWSLVDLAEINPKDYKCLDTLKFQTALRAMHITTDLLLLLYPAFIMKKLQMSLVKKIGICVVFSFGTLCVICSIVRNIIFGRKRLDYTYLAHDVYIWNMADITSACIVPSLPAFYPLFNACYKSICNILSISSPSTPGPTPSQSGDSNSRAKAVQKASSRHDTKLSPRLSEVYGSYTKSDDKSTASGELTLVNAAQQDGAVQPGYVRRVAQTRDRGAGRAEQRAREEAIELEERNIGQK